MPDIHHDASGLSREIQPMPEDVLAELKADGLLAAYRERPAYQQNDYLAWIGRAKHPPTRGKRIEQMLTELRVGGVYMGMDHPASRKN